MDRLGDPGAHPGGRAEHAVEPGVVDHLDDRRHARRPPRRPARPRRRRTRPRWRRWSGCRACPSAAAGGSGCARRPGVQRGKRKQERPPSAWARTRKASHIGADMNHLWPVSSYSAPGPPPFTGAGDRGVGAHVGAALLLGHPHPGEGAALARRRRVARVIGGGEDVRLPLGGQLGLGAQRRDHRVGHRDRAADPGLGLGEAHEGGAAGDVGAGPRVLHGELCSSCSTAVPSSSCQAGWNSTSSTRLP